VISHRFKDERGCSRSHQPLLRLGVWLRPLFGDVTERERHQAWVVGVLIVVGTGLSLLRQAGPPALDTIWAEDGARFLTDALALPVWRSLSQPYAGYLHLWPRAVGELASQLPIGWAAAVLALIAAALAAGTGALIYVATSGHVRSIAARVCIALSVTLTPIASFEILNTTAASQFPLMFAVFWVLLWRPRGRVGVVVGCVIALIGALSAPLTVVFTPLAVVRLLALGSWRERAPALVVLVGAAIQVAVTLSQPFLSQAGAALSDVAWVALVRVALQAVAGTELAMTLWRRIGPPAAVAAGVTLLLLGAFALGRLGASRHTRLLVAVTGAYAAGLAVVSPWLRGGAAGMRWTAEATPLGGARYTYVPILLIICLAAVALDERPRTVPPGWWQGMRIAALIVLAVPVVWDLRAPNPRSQGPRWSTEVNQAVVECRSLHREALVAIDHPPDFGEFFVTVPCTRL
jgi:hypothetical protein